jgi:hypothetical protein
LEDAEPHENLLMFYMQGVYNVLPGGQTALSAAAASEATGATCPALDPKGCKISNIDHSHPNSEPLLP